jgi:hypothetical protein
MDRIPLVPTIALLASTYASRVALRNLRGKHLFVLLGFDFISLIVVFLFYLNTKGASDTKI